MASKSEEDRESSRLWRASTGEPARVLELLEAVVFLEQRSRELIEQHYRLLEALNRISQELDRIRQNNERAN